MTNNDVLRRIRYTFNFDDSKMIAIFGLAGLEVTRAEISDWLKKDDDPDFKNCKDVTLATFLNGLIACLPVVTCNNYLQFPRAHEWPPPLA